nr:MAG TPA: hypothetical protein [Caudoviricetes sp.]
MQPQPSTTHNHLWITRGVQWITCMHNHLPTGYPHPNHRDSHRVIHMTQHTRED